MLALLLLALAQDSDTLETIRDAVIENRTLDSLELRYHHYDPASKVSSPKYTWAFQGRLYLISFDGERGRTAKRWISFDGVRNYQVQYERSGEIRALHKQELHEPFRQELRKDYEGIATPHEPFGWSVPASDQSLTKLLEEARLIGKEEIDGHTCWKVDLGENSSKGNKTNHLTAWFDPDVGYWPRKIEIRPFDFKAGQPNTIKPGQIYVDYRILEFVQVEDAGTGEKRWFPKHCQIHNLLHKKDELVLEDIKINHAIPVERFIPDLSE